MAIVLLQKVKTFWNEWSDRAIVDNYVSRLHCRITFTLLFALSTLATYRDYFGDPIHCVASKATGIDRKEWNTYCWIFSTYSVEKHLEGTIGKDVVYPGVGQGNPDYDEVIRHKYYQWVWMILQIQCAFFYFPRALWNTIEGGRVAMVTNDLQNPSLDVLWYKSRLRRTARFVAVDFRNHHKRYAIMYAVMEVLNLINVVCQMFLFDLFLGGKFFHFGKKVARNFFFNEEDSYEMIMARAFPKVAKCSFYKYGPSGSIQHLDALCVLALNIINEKIVSFLYFWYIFLIIPSIVTIIYRILILEPHIRFQMMKYRFGPHTSPKKLEYVLTKFDFGDCFYLCQLNKNIDQFLFPKLIDEIVIQLDMLLAEKERKFWKPHKHNKDFEKNNEERKMYLQKMFARDCSSNEQYPDANDFKSVIGNPDENDDDFQSVLEYPNDNDVVDDDFKSVKENPDESDLETDFKSVIDHPNDDDLQSVLEYPNDNDVVDDDFKSVKENPDESDLETDFKSVIDHPNVDDLQSVLEYPNDNDVVDDDFKSVKENPDESDLETDFKSVVDHPNDNDVVDDDFKSVKENPDESDLETDFKSVVDHPNDNDVVDDDFKSVIENPDESDLETDFKSVVDHPNDNDVVDDDFKSVIENPDESDLETDFKSVIDHPNDDDFQSVFESPNDSDVESVEEYPHEFEVNCVIENVDQSDSDSMIEIV